MSDKFEKMSIYDLDWKTTDNDGEEQTFTFKPLPFSYYPKLYSLLSKLSESGLTEMNDELSEEARAKKFMEALSEDLVLEIVSLEKAMVKTSYPDLLDEKIDRFVTSNAFNLLDPLMNLMSRTEKVNPRRVQNELSK